MPSKFGKFCLINERWGFIFIYRTLWVFHFKLFPSGFFLSSSLFFVGFISSTADEKRSPQMLLFLLMRDQTTHKSSPHIALLFWNPTRKMKQWRVQCNASRLRHPCSQILLFSFFTFVMLLNFSSNSVFPVFVSLHWIFFSFGLFGVLFSVASWLAPIRVLCSLFGVLMYVFEVELTLI